MHEEHKWPKMYESLSYALSGCFVVAAVQVLLMLLAHPGWQALYVAGDLLFVSRKQIGEGEQVSSFDYDLGGACSDEELFAIPMERNLPCRWIRMKFHVVHLLSRIVGMLHLKHAFGLDVDQDADFFWWHT